MAPRAAARLVAALLALLLAARAQFTELGTRVATLAGGNWSGATGALLDAAAVTATAVNISALGAVALDSDRSFVYYIEAAQAVVRCIDVPQGKLGARRQQQRE